MDNNSRVKIEGDIILKAYDDLKWRTVNPITFNIGLKKITIPAGFETDLASVPKVLWSFCPPFGKYTSAAILHDFMYSKYCVDPIISREVADNIFLEVMEEHGISGKVRKAMYAAVRAAGVSHFEKVKISGEQPIECEKEAIIDRRKVRLDYLERIKKEFGFELLD